LNRMLKRLEGEDQRLRNVVSVGELTPAAAELGARLTVGNREDPRSELRTLMSETEPQS
jgi:hypothetical protein